MAWQKEILFQQWNHLTNKFIFWAPREILFFGRSTKTGETLDEVYRVKRWLYWKIKLLFIKKPLFDLKSHALNDPPSYLCVLFAFTFETAKWITLYINKLTFFFLNAMWLLVGFPNLLVIAESCLYCENVTECCVLWCDGVIGPFFKRSRKCNNGQLLCC